MWTLPVGDTTLDRSGPIHSSVEGLSLAVRASATGDVELGADVSVCASRLTHLRDADGFVRGYQEGNVGAAVRVAWRLVVLGAPSF